MNDSGNAPLQFTAHRNHEALAANGDEVFLGCAFAGELAQRGTQAFFNEFLLALLLAPYAIEFRRGVVGKGAVWLDGALNGFSERTEAGRERRREGRQCRQLADQT